MITVKKLSGLLLLGIIAGALSAQTSDQSIKKMFSAREGTCLRIVNKFGDINIFTVKQDSVSISTEITINQADKELLKRNYSLIRTDIRKYKDTIDVQTVFDEKFFSPSYRKGRTSFRVDYFINVPAKINLFIQNEFGDINLDEISGIVNVKHSNGDFNASNLSRGNITPVNSLRIDLGKITIDEINWISMTVKNCQSVKIGKAKALLLNSEFSKVKIGEISSLVCDSKSDNYEISAIKNLVSRCRYTTFDIGQLSGQLNSNAAFGSISVINLQESFTTVDLTCDHTLIELIIKKGASYKTDVKVTNTLLEFPFQENPLIHRSNDNNAVTLSGLAGKNNETKSIIKIRSSGGALKIK
jgi:hypothetical protein